MDAVWKTEGLAEAMFAADEASRRLGIEIEELAPGRAVARMRISEGMINGHGIAHGGYVFLLADTAFAVACNSFGEPTVARACEIVFLRAAQEGDDLRASAVQRSQSGRSGVYDVTVVRRDGEVIAEFRGQSAVVRGGDETGRRDSRPAT
ncbi:MAG TPA: hydroxyphenylacetyl-CoA thioesterase PaaI [Solirubrobacteraceae bacterium]